MAALRSSPMPGVSGRNTLKRSRPAQEYSHLTGAHGGLGVTRLSRVICGVSIDDQGRQVFAHAVALARRHDAKLVVLHAASPEFPLARGATERVRFLRQLRALGDNAGIDVHIRVQQGSLVDGTLRHARAPLADLIVIGTGRKESRRGLSRWIAERVMREAPCPTLVVPRVDTSTTIEHVLCAVDFSAASQAAVRTSIEIATQASRPLTLLHVLDETGSRLRSHSRRLAKSQFNRANGVEALEKLRFLIAPRDRDGANVRVAVGSPVSEILRTAASMTANLIVIGANCRTGVETRLFGGIGTLLRDASSLVLAVPVPTAAVTSVHLHRIAA